MGLLDCGPNLKRVCCCMELLGGSTLIAVFLVAYYFVSIGIFILKSPSELPDKLDAYGVIISIAAVLLALFLLVGARRQSPENIKLYLYLKFAYLIIILLYIIITFVLGFHWIENLVLDIIWPIEFYFWFCVKSFFFTLIGNDGRLPQ